MMNDEPLRLVTLERVSGRRSQKILEFFNGWRNWTGMDSTLLNKKSDITLLTDAYEKFVATPVSGYKK